MKRVALLLWACAAAALAAASAWAQGTGVNPPVGSIWTYLGATYGAGWSPPPNGVFLSPTRFGAIGDGGTDDTTALQNTLNASGNTGQPIWVGDRLYAFRGALSDNGKHVAIYGNGSTGGQYGTGQVCAQGLRTLTAGLSPALSLTGPGSIVEKVCMDAAAGVNNTTGQAIGIGVGGSNAIISSNSINGYCIDVDFSGTTVNLVDVTIVLNTLLPYNAAGCAAVRGGFGSQTAHTVDPLVWANDIYCGPGGGRQDGIDYYDIGGVRSLWNTPYGCNYGTTIRPGANQAFIWGSFTGILGDTSTTDDLLVDPQASSASVEGNNFTSTWASASMGSESILVQNTGGTGTLAGLSFVGHRTYMVGNSNGMTVNATVKGLDILSSKFCAGATTSSGAAINLAGVGSLNGPAYLNIQDNTIGGCDHFGGTLATGIAVGPNVYTLALGNIRNNKFYQATTPIAWNVTTNQVAASLDGNFGVDDQQDSPVTDAATILTTVKPVGYVTGTAITVTAMGPTWNNRKLTMVSNNASGTLTFGTGGVVSGTTAPFCTGTTVAPNTRHTFVYDQGTQCWVP